MEWTANDVLKAYAGYIDKFDPTYDPLTFWEDMGKIFRSRFDQNMIMENIEYLVPRIKETGAENVLEIGCGFGRLIPMILTTTKVKRYTGLEISQSMIDELDRYLKNYPRENIRIVKGMGQDIPFDAQEFDLTFSHGCLTHIDPRDLWDVTGEIQRVTKNWIIHIERMVFVGEHPQPHRWSHDLSQYYPGWRIVEYGICSKERHTAALLLRRP